MIRKGRINLSAIPKECITTDAKGNKVIWVDFCDKPQKDQYGNDSYIKMSVRQEDGTYKNIYLGDFKPVELKNAQATAQTNIEQVQDLKKGVEQPQQDDLPF